MAREPMRVIYRNKRTGQQTAWCAEVELWKQYHLHELKEDLTIEVFLFDSGKPWTALHYQANKDIRV